MFWFNLLLLLFYFSGVVSDNYSEKPTNLPCKIEDFKCVTGLIQWFYYTTITGIPELGIESSDPLYHEVVEGNLPHVKYNLTKTSVEGLRNCKVKDASFNSNVTSMRLELLCRRFHMDGNYIIDGKLVLIPIKGDGTFYLDATNYHFVLNTETKYWKNEGKTYVAHKKYSIVSTLFGEIDVQFQNLFEGKKELADIVHNFAKQNDQLFASLLDGPVINANLKKFMKNFNKHFKSIPVTELLQLKNIENYQN